MASSSRPSRSLDSEASLVTSSCIVLTHSPHTPVVWGPFAFRAVWVTFGGRNKIQKSTQFHARAHLGGVPHPTHVRIPTPVSHRTVSALQAGDWVILDELNLASQTVLEGLNACLDHRAEVYIPELQRSFACPPSFCVFACQVCLAFPGASVAPLLPIPLSHPSFSRVCGGWSSTLCKERNRHALNAAPSSVLQPRSQNPYNQGGGRKGLPKSFLNRFTQVGTRRAGKEENWSCARFREAARDSRKEARKGGRSGSS